MITLPELLADKQYREWFMKQPQIAAVKRPAPPWRVYLKLNPNSPWLRTEAWTYAAAFAIVKAHLKSHDLYDGTIQSKGVAFNPPTRLVRLSKGGKPVMVRGTDGAMRPQTAIRVWQPSLPDDEQPHIWCTYCRRPTIFRLYKRHHAFKGMDVDLSREERCCICGSSITLVRGY